MIECIVVDDHSLVREGFCALLNSVDNVNIVKEFSNGQECVEYLRSNNKPSLILMDIDMPKMNGIEALKIIKNEFFGIKVILLTMLHEKTIIKNAYDLGADGFLFKNTNLKELETAIHHTLKNEKYFAPEVANFLLKKDNFVDERKKIILSERELEILKLIAEGLTSSEIGITLFISPRTVDTHRNNLIQKLEVNGIVGLVRYALENKIVS